MVVVREVVAAAAAAVVVPAIGAGVGVGVGAAAVVAWYSVQSYASSIQLHWRRMTAESDWNLVSTGWTANGALAKVADAPCESNALDASSASNVANALNAVDAQTVEAEKTTAEIDSSEVP